jgi:hypothetical protein
MRFSFVPVLGLLAAAACAEGQSLPPVVVLVHGRGHMEDDTASLRRAWKAHLDSALARAHAPPLPANDVRLAWYADALDPSRDGECPAATSDTAGFATFARDFLGSLASALPRDESREARTLLGDMLYAIDPSRRCSAQRKVGAVIDAARAEGRPVIVVAYSLGALVTYAELSARARVSNPRSPLRLITIGSPLGNPEIRELLGQGEASLRLPAPVVSWENIYHSEDPFAGPLTQDIKEVVDRAIDADAGDDPHHVTRYLRARATGMALARAVCASAGERPPRYCLTL